MKVNGHIQLYPFMRIVVALIIGIVAGDAYNSVEAVVTYGVASLLLAVACSFLPLRLSARGTPLSSPNGRRSRLRKGPNNGKPWWCRDLW